MTIEVARVERTAVVIMQRPAVRNAMNSDMAEALDTAFDDLAADDDVWAVVLTGAGDQAFCAGQDLKEVGGGQPRRPQPSGGWGGLTRRDFPKPLIAAVNGVALGGGFELVLCCDMVIAEEQARFGLPEVKRGVIASAGGLVRISRRLPPSVALHMALTGEPISAEEARSLGLVNQVVGTGQALPAAIQLGATIAQAAPLAVRLSKRIIRSVIAAGENSIFELQGQLVEDLRRSADFAEGPRAFLEKRPPQWRGS